MRRATLFSLFSLFLAGCGGNDELIWAGGLAPLPETGRTEILLVRPEKSAWFLEKALRANQNLAVSTMEPWAYEIEPRGSEVVIFSGCKPADLPVGRYIFFGAVPPRVDFSSRRRISGEEDLLAEESHPIFADVRHRPRTAKVRGSLVLEAPYEAEPLMRTRSGDLVAATLETKKRRVVVFGFEAPQPHLAAAARFRTLVDRAVDIAAGRLYVPEGRPTEGWR